MKTKYISLLTKASRLIYNRPAYKVMHTDFTGTYKQCVAYVQTYYLRDKRMYVCYNSSKATGNQYDYTTMQQESLSRLLVIATKGGVL